MPMSIFRVDIMNLQWNVPVSKKRSRFRALNMIEAGIVNWPMSVIRIRHTDADLLVKAASHILESWRKYTDEDFFIYAQTDGEPHNTITPIARMRDGKYEFDLVLRNNITTRRTSTRRISSASGASSYQERKHWPDRSNGPCRASGTFERMR